MRRRKLESEWRGIARGKEKSRGGRERKRKHEEERK